jgi:hypothetical protein
VSEKPIFSPSTISTVSWHAELIVIRGTNQKPKIHPSNQRQPPDASRTIAGKNKIVISEFTTSLAAEGF